MKSNVNKFILWWVGIRFRVDFRSHVDTLSEACVFYLQIGECGEENA